MRHCRAHNCSLLIDISLTILRGLAVIAVVSYDTSVTVLPKHLLIKPQMIVKRALALGVAITEVHVLSYPAELAANRLESA